MSVFIVKKFDIIPKIMDELNDDCERVNPSQISFNIDGAVNSYKDVTVELNNGFLKVISCEAVDVIRYKNISAYSLGGFKMDEAEILQPKNWDEVNIHEIWEQISSQPSSLPADLLSQHIPYHIKKGAVISFMAEYNGFSDEELEAELNNDEWLKERYDSYMENNTYKELNDNMACYLWDMVYPAHELRDLFNDGIYNEADELKWINDVISHHIPSHILKEADDDD